METTLDSIKNVELFQSKKGYRFSVDALLLEDFISVKDSSMVMEFGSGSGIISLLLAKRLAKIKIIAVEIQKSLAEYANKNVRLNGLDDRIEVLNEDIKNLRELFPAGAFDCIFSNPPFRKMKSGRLSVNKEKATARHEINISLLDIVSTASYLLKNTGKFFLIYRPLRMIELINSLHKAGIEPKRMRFVHSGMNEEAKMVLIEAVKDSGQWLTIEPPFYIYERDKEYTVEMKRVYGIS